MDSRASSSPAAGKRRRSNSGASTTTDHSRNEAPGDITDEAIAKQRAEHRAMQNRRAQLAHRQRRQAYVFGLQNRVLELEQEVRESTETMNRLKNRISVLERENRDLKQNGGGAVTLDLQTAETPPVSIDNSSTSINTASNSSSHSGSNSSLASSAVFWDNMLMGFGSGINWQPLPSMNPTIDNQSLGILPGLGTIPLPPSSVSTIASSSTFTPTPSPFLLAPSAPSLDEVKFRLRKYIPSLEACSAVDSYFQVAAVRV
ncbi:hypothetical protein BDR26DRAFT_555080 [Obelidium mucronatum]|nr:hypothetical protein BDR26DRAFT_555080 [Obelidium mucronatum]